jgi:hypothetical protein
VDRDDHLLNLIPARGGGKAAEELKRGRSQSCSARNLRQAGRPSWEAWAELRPGAEVAIV